MSGCVLGDRDTQICRDGKHSTIEMLVMEAAKREPISDIIRSACLVPLHVSSLDTYNLPAEQH